MAFYMEAAHILLAILILSILHMSYGGLISKFLTIIISEYLFLIFSIYVAVVNCMFVF